MALVFSVPGIVVLLCTCTRSATSLAMHGGAQQIDSARIRAKRVFSAGQVVQCPACKSWMKSPTTADGLNCANQSCRERIWPHTVVAIDVAREYGSAGGQATVRAKKNGNKAQAQNAPPQATGVLQ